MKKKVAVLFGGCSEEHDVSIKSAKEIWKYIDTEKYDPVYIGISRSGEWKLCEKPTADWDEKTTQRVILSTNKQDKGMLVLKDGTYELVPLDVVFPMIHGKMGEDGTIQGLLEATSIPYVGCGIPASVLCMDKSMTYLTVSNHGFRAPGFKILHDGENADASALKYPVFVKPARSGSSFGVTKVSKPEDLQAAVDVAREFDKKVLIEEAISGMEVGCAVMGNGDDLKVGEVDQITLSHGIFRIHQEDHPEEGSENAVFTVPANLPVEKRKEIQETAKAMYKVLGCKDLSRVDMFLQEDGTIVLNEVNTMPGFTSYSRYPRMMLATGMTFTELIDHCIEMALQEGK